MKARLIYYLDTIELLLCTGKIKKLTRPEAIEFLLNFDSECYYKGSGSWSYENLKMEDYHGETIAFVNDEGSLVVENSNYFRDVFKNNESIKLVTAAEYAKLHDKQSAIIRRFCQAGRIDGAIKKGKTWLIPENSPYPSDERYKSLIFEE